MSRIASTAEPRGANWQEDDNSPVSLSGTNPTINISDPTDIQQIIFDKLAGPTGDDSLEIRVNGYTNSNGYTSVYLDGSNTASGELRLPYTLYNGYLSGSLVFSPVDEEVGVEGRLGVFDSAAEVFVCGQVATSGPVDSISFAAASGESIDVEARIFGLGE